MNDAQFNAIKAMVEDRSTTDVYMSGRTWEDFKCVYWPGHTHVPPGPVRVWVKAAPRKPQQEMAYGTCAMGQPGTGYRVR
jgi:hypothetical protein